MRMMFVLVALLGLVAYSAMAAAPVEKGAKELPTGQKPSQQEKPAATQPQEGSMAVVPAGEFMMGSPTGDSDEQPAHKVYVDSFSMDKYEVTVGQYAAFLQAKGIDPPSDWKTMNRSEHQKRPVANVDWADAFAFCKWAGKRLPTEAEWEKAARGTDDRLYPWGNDPPTPLHANFGKSDWSNHGVLAPIGSFENGKSPYGIYDMAGNVWEWVNDWYDYNYYKNSPSQSPTGPSSGGTKVIRGGAWNSNPRAMRSSNRSLTSPTDQGLTGFRCAKTP
ncbi:MAG TPA: formylglycine-generating enzyme family protein [Nitrospiraceae bacterium]|jgi:formylglycine-generating enzyme required for sulfatase activity|nr:formylglycine-generating enzyme family protein [Nitrospiraceae bacterium]